MRIEDRLMLATICFLQLLTFGFVLFGLILR